MELLGALALGFFLGIRHATDADHIIAVSTMVGRSSRLRDAVRTGALWGVGHTLTVVGVGVAMILFGLVVSPRTAKVMELLVGAMLIVLGVVAVGAHRSGARRDALCHAIAGSRIRPLIVGMVHGLAGSAAMTLLALTTIQRKAGALAYLGLFGVGTVAGMMLITLLLALPFLLSKGQARAHRIVALASGAASIVVGLVILFQLRP